MNQQIQTQVQNALSRIQHLFDANKSVLLHEQDHVYSDKYLVIQFVADQTIYELDQIFKQFQSVLRRDKTLSTLLLFDFNETCVFKLKRDVKVPVSNTITEKTNGIFKSTSQKEVSEVVTEYVWDFVLKFKLYFRVGSQEQIINQGEIKKELKTTSDINPRKQVGIPFKQFQCNPFEYLEYSQILNPGKKLVINRQDPQCFTPRRNPEIQSLSSCYSRINGFCFEIVQFFRVYHYDLVNQEINLENCLREMIMVIASVPVFTKQSVESPLQKNFAESLQSNLDSIMAKYKDASLLPAVKLLVLLEYIQASVANFHASVDYVESLLRQQLVDAIGKEITIKDMEDYMIFHNRQILKREYHPKPISIDVRRAGYTPEGSVQIEVERNSDSGLMFSVTREISDAPNVSFDLNSSISIALKGSHFIHASISQKYSTEPTPIYSLFSRARQFSCFILLVGTIVENNKFDLQNALIISNKDDLRIPLIFETIPTAQEFRDAIKSLSPNQQRFAKSIRAMQMQSTMFTFCIVQIKPQLENILNLPPGSLTKEIKLTQDLLKLFIEFQIPSDLMKFDGEATLNVKDQIQAVKTYTSNILEMIEDSKKQEYDARMKLAELSNEENGSLKVKKGRGGNRSSGYGIGARAPFELSDGFAIPQPMVASMAMPSAAPRMMMMPSPAPPASFAMPPPPPPVVQPAPVPGNTAPANEANPPVYDELLVNVESASSVLNYTTIPKTLETNFDVQNCGSVRPTIIKVGPSFTKKSQMGLLQQPTTTSLDSDQQKTEKNKALDLLDALSRSGELIMDESSIHIVIVSTQCFDQTLINQVIQRDCNPIDLIERSTLVMAKAVHEKPVHELLVPSAVNTVKSNSPCLFE